MKYLFLILIFFLHVKASSFSVATYNVENLFDINHDGNEYKEYIPNSKSNWNEKLFSIKLNNLTKVIKDLDADILVLQEIENQNALTLLNQNLGTQKYPFTYIQKNKGIKSALLSRFEIIDKKFLHVKTFPRAIEKIKVNVYNQELSLFINHWPSYKHGVKARIAFAKALKRLYQYEKEYILLGDFNAPFVVDKRGWGKALEKINEDSRNYNLWYELSYKQRYSYSFYTRRYALDHMIISKDMFDDKDIEYKEDSFEVYKPSYVKDTYDNPKRWQISRKAKGIHLGKGFSDHFALKAVFEVDTFTKRQKRVSSIKEIYAKYLGRVNLVLKDVKVTKVTKYGAFIEDRNLETIYIYRPDFKMQEGERYTLHVKNIQLYKGKKEITLCTKIK